MNNKFFFILFLVFLLISLNQNIVATDYDGFVINKIEIISNTVPEGKILSILDLKKGDPITKEQLKIGFKNIYSLGVFKDLKIDVQVIEVENESRVDITIMVHELMRIKKISFIGNKKYSDEALADEISAKAGGYYSPALMREVKLFIKNKYREEGYLMTEVISSVEKIPDVNEVQVVIDINEGLEMLVGKINFHGNFNLTSKKIKSAMTTKEDKWFREGKFDDYTFEEDKERIIFLYKKNGFYQAKIDKASISYRWKKPKTKKARNVNVDIWVTEGDTYFFGQSTIKGNKIFTLAEIEKELRRYPGDYYDEEIHQRDLERMTLLYHSRGYIFARITPIEQVNEEDKTIDYVFDIYEGDKAHIEKIIVKGNTKTKEHVIRREINIREGEIFDRFKIQRSLEKLVRTQYFKNVIPQPAPGSVEGLMNLTFEVEEQSTGTISAGAGWGTSTGFTLLFEIKEINFLGKGYGLGAKTDLGLTHQLVDVYFLEPYLFKQPISSRVSIFFSQRDFFLAARPDTTITNSDGTTATNSDGTATTTNDIFFTDEDVNELPLEHRSRIDPNNPVLPYKVATIGLGASIGYRFADWMNVSFGLNYNVEFEYWDEIVRLDSIHPRTQLELWNKHKDKFVVDGFNNEGLVLLEGLRRDPIHTLNISLGISRDTRDNLLEPHRGSYLSINLDLITGGYNTARWRFHAQWNKTFLWKLTFHAATTLSTLGPLFGQAINYPEERHYFFYQEELRGWTTTDINDHRRDVALPHYNGIGSLGELTFDNLLAGNARGQAKILHTLEIRWPFFEGIIGGSIFLDAGNITRRELNDRWLGYLYDPTIYLYSWGFGIRIHIPQLPIRFYFPWKFAYNPASRQLEYFNMNPDVNGAYAPGFVFTIAGFF